MLSSIAGRSLALLGALASRTGFLSRFRSARPGSTSWRSWRDRSETRASSRTARRVGQCAMPALNPLMRAAAGAGPRAAASGRIRSAIFWKRTDQNLMASLLADAARIAGSDGPVEDRLVAIRLLGLADAKTARGLFPSLFDARQPMAVQLAVLQALGGASRSRFRPSRCIALEVDEPVCAPRGAEVLFSRREGFEAVVGAFESRAILPSELDPARLNAVPGIPGPVIAGSGPEDSCGRNIGVTRPRPGHRLVPAGDPACRRSTDKGARSFLKVAPPAIRPRVEGSTSGPTWRPSQAGLRRTFSPISSTRTERSRRTS